MSTVEDAISVKWAAVILGAVVALIGISVVAVSLNQDKKNADVVDFDSCVAAGNPVMESYPEQCAANGTTYTNKTQFTPDPPAQLSEYIGLSESDALAAAKKDNITARVVERNGEDLPVTMDFMFGRYNLHIKDDVVYKVEVEGQATDSPGIAE